MLLYENVFENWDGEKWDAFRGKKGKGGKLEGGLWSLECHDVYVVNLHHMQALHERYHKPRKTNYDTDDALTMFMNEM